MANLESPEWLGEVPGHWQLVPLKTAFARVKRAAQLDQGIVTAFRDGEVTLRSNRRADGYTEADDYSSYQSIYPGDLAIHSMDSFAGAIGVSDSFGICSPVLSVCVPKNANDARYMAYQLRLMSTRGWIEALSRSVRERTSEFRWAEAGRQTVAVPPVEEQKEIADFLDRELQDIDVLIGKQESLIAGLFERRTSLVSTVTLTGTRGKCASNSKPIDWLPPVPDHWRVAPLWSMFRRVKTTGHPDLDLLALYREHGVLPKASRNDNHNVESEDLSSYQLVKQGDLVVNKMKAWQGSISLSALEGIISPAYFVYRPHHEQNSRYFHYLLRSAPYVAEYNKISKGVRIGQWDLEPQLFRSLPVLVPTDQEQKEIVAFLDSELEKNTFLMDQCKGLVALLKERKEALVSAAVTGKINVRGKS